MLHECCNKILNDIFMLFLSTKKGRKNAYDVIVVFNFMFMCFFFRLIDVVWLFCWHYFLWFVFFEFNCWSKLFWKGFFFPITFFKWILCLCQGENDLLS
jgi:hypothetical protein